MCASHWNVYNKVLKICIPVTRKAKVKVKVDFTLQPAMKAEGEVEV
jgi:hypothetical protein